MKSHTDLEQSKRLAGILPIESADMYYKYVLPKSDVIRHVPEIGNPIESLKWYNEGYTFRGKREPITLREYCIPCWSLAALLEELNRNCWKVSLKCCGAEWDMTYDDGERYISVPSDYAIDACYGLIIKLHELKML